MKLTLLWLTSLLSSCAVGPHSDITLADGTVIRLGTSNSVAAKQENVVASAEVTLPSGHKIALKQSVKKQDAENVPLMGIAGNVMNTTTKAAAGVQRAVIGKDRAIAIGAQNADVAKFGIDKAAKSGAVDTAAGAGATFTPVTVSPP